jgi:hypothetical protein
LRTRVRNRLRQLERRWRHVFPQPVPRWVEPVEPRMVVSAERVEITVESVGQLRATFEGTARAVVVTVAAWQAPWRGWSGRLGPLPGLLSQVVRLPERGRGAASVEVVLAEAVPLQRLVTAALAMFAPVHPLPAAIRADVGVDVLPGGSEEILVDATAANPRGRSRCGPDQPRGVLSVADGRWRVTVDDVVVAGRIGDPLDTGQSTALARLGAITALGGPDELSCAAALAQLAMTGVILHAPDLPVTSTKLLAPELTALLQAPLPGPDADPLEWELRSVAQRREALRRHGTGFQPPPVSALLVSRRPGNVARAVAALAAQTYPELEIVVGLHGIDAPADLAAGDRPLQVVALAAELSFGEALAAVTMAARGSLVTKVDDDDRYGPEHVWDLVLARHYSGATVAGKAAEFVYLAPYGATIRRRMATELYTDVVAGGTLLLSRGDLEAVGGWRPLARSVDRALLDRVLSAGGLVYRTHAFGFVYTREAEGHTWDPGMRYFLRNPHRHWSGLPAYPEFGG